MKSGSPSSGDRKRLCVVALSVCFLFCLLIVQFFKIQIIEGDKWTRVAKRQHQLVVIEPFQRGLFYSNASIKKGHPEEAQPFVVDVPKFHLYIDPEAIPVQYRDELALALSKYLKTDHQKVREQFYKKSRSRKLMMWLGRETRDPIQKWWFAYAKQRKIPRNALFFVQDYQRSYPFGKLLGQVLHTVREDRDEQTHQSIPTGGLEMVFNEQLQGKLGKRMILRSPRHPLDTGQVVSHPEHGADVYLTINHYLQAIAEEEICKAVTKANAKEGWAIMMDPKTGEILALAQYPWFDPSDYRTYFNDEKKKEFTRVKGITDPYEPGSVMKPITIAIALKANAELKKQGKKPIFSPDEKIATSPRSFPGRNKPIKDLRTHHYLNMYLGLQKSSNVYMSTLVRRIIDTMGEQWYRKTLQETFGFGEKTGIELPGESVGLLPTPGKMHPNGALEWSAPTPYSLAMGHNILASSLQMIRSYGVIANGGFEVRPTLVRKIVKNGETLLDHTQKKEPRRVLEPEVVAEVTKAMKFITKPGGSGTRAGIPGYSEAGKTGTSEKIVNGAYCKDIHISTFIGFAPAKDPRFVLLIAIDEPEKKYIPGLGKNQQAGTCAAPAFSEIGRRTLEYLGVEPDDPYGYPVGDPRADPKKADWAKETQALQELYRLWNG